MLKRLINPQPKGKPMSVDARHCMHDVHTATQDVLEGYHTMLERAESDIRPTVLALTQLHQRHAEEQECELQSLGDSGNNDSSIQGTVNKATVILRDWFAGLDHDALSAVRQGEEALRDRYVKAMESSNTGLPDSTRALLMQQHAAICDQIARLPKS